MRHFTPTTITVMHADHVAALCTRDRVFLAASVDAMPQRHPDRVFVEAKCLVARAYLVGDADGEYDDQECETAARILLGEPDPSLTRPPAPVPAARGARWRRRPRRR